MSARPHVTLYLTADRVSVEIRVFAPHDEDLEKIKKLLAEAYMKVDDELDETWQYAQ